MRYCGEMARMNHTRRTARMQSDRTRFRLRYIPLWLALAAGLFVASAIVGSGSSAQAQNGDGVLFGAFVNPDRGDTQIEGIQRLEGQLGAKLPIVRTFRSWEDNLDNRLHNWILSGDRRLMISINPTRGNGSEVSWRSIANAQPGSRIHNDMVALARDVRDLDGEVWIAFHHEPEAVDRQSYGDSDDFIAAWRAIHRVFDQQGADAQWVWTMTSFSFRVNEADRRHADNWYPGDAFVDMLGADPYNWNYCRSATEGPRELADNVLPVMEWADRHGIDKPLVLPEWAAATGNGGKAGWLTRAADFLRQPEVAERFAAVIYFHSEHQGNANCDWWLDSSNATLDAARRIAQDPFFQRDATLAVATRAATPVDPFEICTVRSTARGDLVEWSDRGPNWRYNVRRNDRWVAATDDNRLVNERHTNGSYIVIARTAGERIDTTCVRI